MHSQVMNCENINKQDPSLEISAMQISNPGYYYYYYHLTPQLKF